MEELGLQKLVTKSGHKQSIVELSKKNRGHSFVIKMTQIISCGKKLNKFRVINFLLCIFISQKVSKNFRNKVGS